YGLACGYVQIEPMGDELYTPSPENGHGREYELRLSQPAACKVWDVTVIRPDEHVDSDEREVFHEQVDTLGRARKLFAELRKLYCTISRTGRHPGSSPGAARLTTLATACIVVTNNHNREEHIMAKH